MDNLIAQHLVYWHWWVLAAVLLSLELMIPAAFLIWISLAATMMGIILLIEPGIAWQWQLFMFAILSVVSVFVGRHYFIKRRSPTDQPHLSRRGEYYMGRVFTLQEPIVNGVGRVQVDDSIWRIQGEDMPPGSRIEVTGVEGATLLVKRAD